MALYLPIQKIKFLKEQYSIGELPIQIHTSIPLYGNEYINMEEQIDETIINKENNKICVDNLDKENNINKQEDFIFAEKNSLLDNRYNLFCVVPWTELCIGACNTLQFGAGSKAFGTDNYKYDEIWNCKELVVYRNNIIKKDLSLCEKLCREREDDSKRIRLGLTM